MVIGKKFTVTLFFILLLCFADLSACAQKKGEPLYKAEFGVQAYTFRRSFPNDIAATLDTIKMMGFTEIEGSGGRITPEEFRKLCDERGIKIPSTGTGYDQLV